jgi:hypothetical protein
MNDLDLRTVLHRDAELVGAPSADLLDQLLQRRQHQRRRRAGLLTAGLAVAVVAAGIPVGTSLLARSDDGPASQTTVAPTPSVIPEGIPAATPEVVPATPTPSIALTPEPEAQAPAPASNPVTCPDLDTLRATLPADTADRRFSMVSGEEPVCSGSWGAAGYSESNLLDGQWWGDGQAGLFHYVDGSWTWLDRYTSNVCDDSEVPRDVWERACNVD